MNRKIACLLICLTLFTVNNELFGARRSSSRSRSTTKYKSSSGSSWSSNPFSSKSSTNSNSSKGTTKYRSAPQNKESFTSNFTGKQVTNESKASKNSFDNYNEKKTTGTSSNATKNMNTSTNTNKSTNTNTSTNSNTNMNNNQYRGSYGRNSGSFLESMMYISAIRSMTRPVIYTNNNRITSNTEFSNDEFLKLVTDLPDDSIIRYFTFNRNNKNIKRFMKDLNSYESEDKEFNEKVDLLNNKMDEAYAKDRKKDRNNILTLLIFAGLIGGGYTLLKKQKSKPKKVKKINLPFGLEVGSFLEFDELLFSNLDYDTKFFLKNNRNIVESYGISNIDGIDIVNIYLKNEDENNIYLQVHIQNEEVVKSILFKNLDIVYPKTVEDWNLWLGDNSGELGLLGEEYFYIEGTKEDIIQDSLYKFVKRINPQFNKFSNIYLKYNDKDLETNLFNVASNGDKEQEERFIEEYEKDIYLKRIIKDIKKIDDKCIMELEVDEIIKYSEVEYKNTNYGNYIRKEVKEGREINKKEALYKRDIKGEFFDCEYLLLSSTVDEDRAYISIDVGVYIDLGLYKI